MCKKKSELIYQMDEIARQALSVIILCMTKFVYDAIITCN